MQRLAEESPIRLRVRPLQILAQFVLKRPLTWEQADLPLAKRRGFWLALYSFEKGDKPSRVPSAAVAGPRFLQSQLKGPSKSNKKRPPDYGYITKAANQATCSPDHVACTGYTFKEFGKSGFCPAHADECLALPQLTCITCCPGTFNTDLVEHEHFYNVFIGQMGNIRRQCIAEISPDKLAPAPQGHLRLVHLHFCIMDYEGSGNDHRDKICFTLEFNLDDPIWHSDSHVTTANSPFHPQARNQPELGVWRLVSQ